MLSPLAYIIKINSLFTCQIGSHFLYYHRILNYRKVEFMISKRKRPRHNHFKAVFVLGMEKTEQMKGRDKTMLQKGIEYWQEVNGE